VDTTISLFQLLLVDDVITAVRCRYAANVHSEADHWHWCFINRRAFQPLAMIGLVCILQSVHHACVQEAKAWHFSSSFRPFSNLYVMSKLFERLVAAQLIGYLESPDLLPQCKRVFDSVTLLACTVTAVGHLGGCWPWRHRQSCHYEFVSGIRNGWPRYSHSALSNILWRQRQRLTVVPMSMTHWFDSSFSDLLPPMVGLEVVRDIRQSGERCLS